MAINTNKVTMKLRKTVPGASSVNAPDIKLNEELGAFEASGFVDSWHKDSGTHYGSLRIADSGVTAMVSCWESEQPIKVHVNRGPLGDFAIWIDGADLVVEQERGTDPENPNTVKYVLKYRPYRDPDTITTDIDTQGESSVS